MESKNKKNKAAQTKKVSEVSDNVVNEIMDMKVGSERTEKTKTVEEPAPVVEEMKPVVTEVVPTEDKTEELVSEVAEPAVEEGVAPEDDKPEVAPDEEEEVKEETSHITPDVTAVKTEVVSTTETEEESPLSMPITEVGSQNPTVENDSSVLKDNEEKKAPRPRRRTTREVYGYDVSGYNFDL